MAGLTDPPRYVGRHPAGYGREPVVGDGAGGADPGHQVGPGRTTPTPAGHTTPSPVTTTRLLSLSPGPWYRLTGKWCEEQKHCQVLRADIKYLEHFITIGRNGGGSWPCFTRLLANQTIRNQVFTNRFGGFFRINQMVVVTVQGTLVPAVS